MPDSTDLQRSDVYPRPLVDGRPASNGPFARLGRAAQSLMVSKRERNEAGLEARLRTIPTPLTRPNTIAVSSPRGGAGTTTVAMALAAMIASHQQLWTVVVDANPAYGSLTSLAPPEKRPARSLGDLIDDLGSITTASEIHPYVAHTPTGLHILGGRPGDDLAPNADEQHFGQLLSFLSTYYPVVVVDTGSGGRHPLAKLATAKADQTIVVTPPDPASAGPLAPMLEAADHDRTTVVCNRPEQWRDLDAGAVEAMLAENGAPESVALAYDQKLARTLVAGEYSLDKLASPTRMALKRVGAAAVQRLA